MMDEAGFIINKCGRLPKLIVALGNYFNKAPNIIQEMRLNANFMYELNHYNAFKLSSLSSSPQEMHLLSVTFYSKQHNSAEPFGEAVDRGGLL